MKYYVYIIQSRVNNRYYIGCTNNLAIRIKAHNSGHNTSTKNGCPWELMRYRKFDSQEEAFQHEKKVKSYKGGNAFKKIVDGEVAEWSKAAHC